MTHLPECTDDLRWMLNPGEWVDEDTGEAECVLCCMLLACERRVRQEERTLVAVEQTTLAELNAEYRKGVQAAREAVADARKWPAYLPPNAGDGLFVVITEDDALAAIDAMRGEDCA